MLLGFVIETNKTTWEEAGLESYPAVLNCNIIYSSNHELERLLSNISDRK